MSQTRRARKRKKQQLQLCFTMDPHTHTHTKRTNFVSNERKWVNYWCLIQGISLNSHQKRVSILICYVKQYHSTDANRMKCVKEIATMPSATLNRVIFIRKIEYWAVINWLIENVSFYLWPYLCCACVQLCLIALCKRYNCKPLYLEMINSTFLWTIKCKCNQIDSFSRNYCQTWNAPLWSSTACNSNLIDKSCLQKKSFIYFLCIHSEWKSVHKQ